MSQATPPRFQTTRWSLIRRAGDERLHVRTEALGELLRAYLAPLRHYLISGLRLRADRADDLLQSFVSEKVLEQQLVTKAEQSRGKFRTFLLASLRQFVTGEIRRENRALRRPEELTALDEIEELIDPRQVAPDEAFELSWARGVLDRAVWWMRQQCRDSFREDLWAVFHARILGPAATGGQPVPYEQILGQLGVSSVTEAQNLLVTAKRMFARSLREIVSEYVESGAEVEEEIAGLWAALARAAPGAASPAEPEPP